MISGEKSVFYLYVRYRFNWDEKEYSIYFVYKFIGLVIGKPTRLPN